MNVEKVLSRSRRVAGRLRAQWWAAVHPNVQVGSGAWVGRGCRLRLDATARLVLGDGCAIDDGTTLAVYGQGLLELGAGSFVGHHSTLAARQLVHIGDGTYLAELVSVRDHDHALGHAPSSGEVQVTPVQIGNRVWLASKVTVIRGAVVGDDTVVGANAVVRGDLPQGVVAAGIPARVLRSTTESEERP